MIVYPNFREVFTNSQAQRGSMLTKDDLASFAWRMDFGEDAYSLARTSPTGDHIGSQPAHSPTTDSAFGMAPKSTSPSQRSSPLGDAIEGSAPATSCGIPPLSRSPWSPQSDDLLHGFRTSLQTGDRSKFVGADFAGKYADQQMQMFAPRTNRSNMRKNGEPYHNSNSHGSHQGHYNHHNDKSHHENAADLTSKYRFTVSPGASDLLEFESAPQRTWSAVVKKNLRPMEQHRSRDFRASNTFITLTACCATPKLKVICSCCHKETNLKDEMRPRVIPVATSQLGFCRFCQSNGDPAEVYRSHALRSDDGKVTCPVLREYNCPLCNNGGGDFAHTVKYCPLARKAKPGH